MIKYREYEIRYNEGVGGVTVYRNAPSYGAEVRYKNSFKSLEDGLMFLAERVATTENSELSGVLLSLRTLRSDLKSVMHKLCSPDTSMALPQDIPKAVEVPVAPKKMIKKIIKKG